MSRLILELDEEHCNTAPSFTPSTATHFEPTQSYQPSFTETPLETQEYEEDEKDIDIFISTQVQSRIDEIDEQEDVQRKALDLLSRFKNNSNNNASVNVETNKALKSTFSIITKKAPSKKKASSTKTTTKRRRTKDTKPKSITESMLLKLSGKPQKIHSLIKASAKDDPKFPKLKQLLNGDITESDLVLTREEWRRVEFVLGVPLVKTKEDMDPAVDSTLESKEQNSSLWNSASNIPDLITASHFKQSSSLSSGHLPLIPNYTSNGHTIEDNEDQDFITLSQIMGIRTTEPTPEEVQTIPCSQDYRPLPQYYHESDTEVEAIDEDKIIECSEDEGELLKLRQTYQRVEYKEEVKVFFSGIETIRLRNEKAIINIDEGVQEETVENSEDEGELHGIIAVETTRRLIIID